MSQSASGLFELILWDHVKVLHMNNLQIGQDGGKHNKTSSSHSSDLNHTDALTPDLKQIV